MVEKAYYVTLEKGVDPTDFCDHMEKDTTNTECGCIPDRTVDVNDRKPASLRTTKYMLTDEEANHLRTDPRVKGVESDPVNSAKDIFAIQTGDFDRYTQFGNGTGAENFVNWGLRRHILQTPELTEGTQYTYNLDGTGVDVVIQDDGVMSGHPEWEDKNGVSRFNEIDWYTATGSVGTMPAGHYGDVGAHGTHVASTVAGKTYGWAKNAQIYSIRFDLMPTGDEFDLVRLWHQQKTNGRPTLLNASWGYSWYRPGYSLSQTGNITDIQYRGVSQGTTESINYGMANTSTQGGSRPGRHNFPYAVIDAACEDMTDAGVIMVKAAGNYYHKQDVFGGADYDNHYTIDTSWANIIQAGDPIYYHRPGAPHSDDCIVVGNMDDDYIPGFGENSANNSEKGPRVDIWAAGTQITAATNSTGFGSLYDNVYPPNNSYKISRISGTSMASPNVCGVVALFLQLYPNSNINQIKGWLFGNASAGMNTGTGTGTDYSDATSIQGAPNRILYNPFNKGEFLLKISNA